MIRLAITTAALILAGCVPRPELDPPAPDEAVVVYWTVSGLGTRVAGDIGMCELLKDAALAHDTSVTCLRGAIPPSSTTAESHLRTLYPGHNIGPGRSAHTPDCDADSLPGAIAQTWDQVVLFATDTPGFTDSSCQGERSWLAEADTTWLSEGSPSHVALVPETERPVALALDDLLQRTARGEGVVAVLGDLEAGGQRPRCWFDPYTSSCDALWRFGLQQGLVQEGADRQAVWLEDQLWDELVLAFEGLPEAERPPLREQLWGSVVDGAEHFTHARLLTRLDRLLAGLDEQGRLDDLTLVLVGDHGESPCVADPLTGQLDCADGGPGDYSARVPAYVIPSSAGELWVDQGLVGGPRVPWSTVNLSHGLLHTLDVPTPDTWPQPEATGHATSWTCSAGSRGLRVVQDVSLRCADDQCGAWEWATPEDLEWAPAQVEEIPAEVAGYAGETNWFEQACAR